jgi:hypothetical protein
MTPIEDRKARYLARGLYVRSVLSVPIPDQTEAFAEIERHLSDYSYWRLASHIWRKDMIPNYSERTRKLWLRILRAPRPRIENFARRYPGLLAILPDPIPCYRGHGPDNREGFHYSLNLRIAEVFARPFGTEGHVSHVFLPKRDCLWFGHIAEVVYVPGLGDVLEKVKMQIIDAMLAEAVQEVMGQL